MSRISYSISLRERADRIRVDFETQHEKVIAIHVVQYEAFIEGNWCPITRYNTAHGFFHQDIYTARGNVKYRVAIRDLNQALTYAIQDLKENWQRYRRQFIGAHR